MMTEVNGNRTLLVAALAGLATFLFQAGQTMLKITDFSIWTDPPTLGHMLIAVAGGLTAFVGALNVDRNKLRRKEEQE